MLKPFLYEGNYVCYPMITIVEEDRTIRNNKLQEIVLFDKAETELGLGQINFRKTSSFCEPGNFVNGVNLDTSYISEIVNIFGKNIKVYDYNKQVESNIKYIRDNGYKSGIHICCAGEWEFGRAGDDIYTGVGIGVPNDAKDAILFMESVGKTEKTSDEEVIDDIVKSIKQIGLNQKIEYEEIYVAYQHKVIKKDLGCALVVIPYFLKE